MDLLAARRVNVAPLITLEIGLEALPGELANPSPNQTKIVVIP